MSSSKSFPGFEYLYLLDTPSGEKCFRANFKEMEDTSLMRAEVVPAKPLQTYWSLGRSNPGPIAIGSSVSLFYFHSDVLQLFKSAGLTGWSTYPIDLHNRAGELCEGYAGLSITGRCGPIDETRGELLPGQRPDTKFPMYRGIYFEESTWDGSDFFCPNDKTAFRFVSRRVVKLLSQNKIKGLRFTPLTKAARLGTCNFDDHENDDDRFLESLYMDQDLDPKGFVTPPITDPFQDEVVDYTVCYPYDNRLGMKCHVCSTFNEAKAYVLHLQSQGVKESTILKKHDLIWQTPGMKM